ncbi:hypothetical protein EMIHUDRAFT_225122 [Emiliania huxleyi CCMP1516]|uniref:U3 small nucleolar RNA-associated protein 11 n=2 Tax=Emiliania huxleyi TaxID=2903 RepID=A0A0D3KQ05_EMIH1|nr:hypothetical protein EMIHUDRAFT_225122 [Emiliania huxleyi CCMP1516]EOD37840.1 hypothetical protein EMIHUDRAFT_225122 [Emiliania huxleyi CCMP1516]|eukprot:XP_005790269.1 hypothetical protein EMIHUDRAFT_225122 [Emiliania huxleyi CCMP1516]
MSSLRHVVKSRPYRERSQPAARAKLGLLEKHKDYVLRARDFHKKQACADTIHRMRDKAAAKNPDEFYFGMNRSQMTGGVHKKAKEAGPSGDELKAFRKDDATYKVAKLRANLHGVSQQQPPQNKRTVFGKHQSKPAKQLAARYSELHQREERERKLAQCVQRLATERALLGKGRRKKLQSKSGQPRQFKWRQERKRPTAASDWDFCLQPRNSAYWPPGHTRPTHSA